MKLAGPCDGQQPPPCPPLIPTIAAAWTHSFRSIPCQPDYPDIDSRNTSGPFPASPRRRRLNPQEMQHRGCRYSLIRKDNSSRVPPVATESLPPTQPSTAPACRPSGTWNSASLFMQVPARSQPSVPGRRSGVPPLSTSVRPSSGGEAFQPVPRTASTVLLPRGLQPSP